MEHIELHGSISNDQLPDILHELREKLNKPRNSACLINLQQARLNLSNEELCLLVVEIKKLSHRHRKAIAAVAVDDLSFGLLRILGSRLASENFSFHVTRDCKGATEWLREQADNPQASSYMRQTELSHRQSKHYSPD
tara:strand:+ start:2742 stop:3155 length:414 start_codon:yes stop_codon:yes gene_type:complete